MMADEHMMQLQGDSVPRPPQLAIADRYKINKAVVGDSVPRPPQRAAAKASTINLDTAARHS